tara:strand:- start:8788 stop:9807 length:1020 start_codon:yes stop_codon:yes gene_type:complete
MPISKLKKDDLKFINRINNFKIWDEVLKKSNHSYIEYTNYFIDYQISFFNQNYTCNDLSIILLLNDKPIAILPILKKKDYNKTNEIILLEDYILPPLYILNLDKNFIEELNSFFENKIIDIFNKYGLNKIKILYYKDSNDQFLINYQKNIISNEDLSFIYLDLQPNIDIIKKSFRKSYKSLINQGNKIFNIKIYSKYDEKFWEKFQNFHYEISGKKTRSNDTWEIQKKLLINNRAFIVASYNLDQKMIGAAFFTHSFHESSYSIGLYKKNYYNLPIGHCIQFHAINEMKRRSIKFYRLGEFNKKELDFEKNKKLKNIIFFKKGFSSHINVNKLKEFSIK